MDQLNLFVNEKLKLRVMRRLKWSAKQTGIALKAYKEFLELKNCFERLGCNNIVATKDG